MVFCEDLKEMQKIKKNSRKKNDNDQMEICRREWRVWKDFMRLLYFCRGLKLECAVRKLRFG
jgi:hypothetical protein